MQELRDYQVAALDRLVDLVRAGKRRIVLQSPTGSGKTRLAAEIALRALGKGKRVLFTVPSISLVDQTVMHFWREGLTKVGVIQADHEMTDWDQPVQVASVQTLLKRKMPQVDVVILDEIHRWSKLYQQWLPHPDWEKVPVIGLSATPWLRGLGRYFSELVIAGTTADMIERGHLSPFKVFAPSHPDLTGVRTVAGDYHEGELSEAMRKGKLVADVVETWQKLAEGRPTLCFAVDRAHARHLQNKFLEAGIPTGYVDMETKRDEREQIREKLASGEYKVVVNIACLTTGVDWDVRCISLCRPTKSEMLFVQIIGRGLRTAAGKDYCLILDHSDTHLRLGFVTDIMHENLNDGRTPANSVDRKAPLPKECVNCHVLRPARTNKCPNCGHEHVPQEKRREVIDGELLEFNGKTRAESKKVASIFQRHEAYGMLKYIAQEFGYKPAWARYKFQVMFGTFPEYASDHPMMIPNQAMRRWVKSQNIAWAHSRNREERSDYRMGQVANAGEEAAATRGGA